MTRFALFLFIALSFGLHAALLLFIPELQDAEIKKPVPLRVGLVRQNVKDSTTAAKKSVSSAASAPSPSASQKSAPKEVTQKPKKTPAPVQQKPLPVPRKPRSPEPSDKEPVTTKAIAPPVKDSAPEPRPEVSPAPRPFPLPKREQEANLPEERSPETRTGSSAVPAETRSQEPAPSPFSLPSEAASAGARIVQAAPDYASNPPPGYPRVARQRGWEGTVTVRVRVSSSGRVATVSLERSSGYPLLDRSALRAVRNWRFYPARQGEIPIESEVLVPVIFRLKER